MFGLNANYIIIGLLLISGILLIIMGVVDYKHDKMKLLIKRCTAKTKAEIIGFDENDKIVKTKQYTEHYKDYSMKKNKKETFYCPYISFKDENDELYETKYMKPLIKRLSVGQRVEIRYNPKNPYEFYIIGDKSIKVNSTQSILYGILLLLASIIFLFKNI